MDYEHENYMKLANANASNMNLQQQQQHQQQQQQQLHQQHHLQQHIVEQQHLHHTLQQQHEYLQHQQHLFKEHHRQLQQHHHLQQQQLQQQQHQQQQQEHIDSIRNEQQTQQQNNVLSTVANTTTPSTTDRLSHTTTDNNQRLLTNTTIQHQPQQQPHTNKTDDNCLNYVERYGVGNSSSVGNIATMGNGVGGNGNLGGIGNCANMTNLEQPTNFTKFFNNYTNTTTGTANEINIQQQQPSPQSQPHQHHQPPPPPHPQQQQQSQQPSPHPQQNQQPPPHPQQNQQPPRPQQIQQHHQQPPPHHQQHQQPPQHQQQLPPQHQQQQPPPQHQQQQLPQHQQQQLPQHQQQLPQHQQQHHSPPQLQQQHHSPPQHQQRHSPPQHQQQLPPPQHQQHQPPPQHQQQHAPSLHQQQQPQHQPQPQHQQHYLNTQTPIQSNTIDESITNDLNKLKRKFDNTTTTADNDDTLDAKKTMEEKKINNLRKNIRDVMDETQLDTSTLAAQREESERLARVAEQQKAMREHQRQTAVHRNFVRTQNRVMSLLQSSKTYAKITDSSNLEELPPPAINVEECTDNSSSSSSTNTTGISATATTAILASSSSNSSSQLPTTTTTEVETIIDDEKSSTSMQSNTDADAEQTSQPADVVTIEDSSSEDDCILLSDDEDELLEDEPEDDPHNSGLHVNDSYNLPDEQGRVVVNVGHKKDEEDIFVAPQIAKTIKPHQVGGVRFLFDNIIESTKRFQNSSGFGCILAHSMGLGKTLQIVCFCDIFLRHTNSKTVLCVMPINTLQNWMHEFNMWLPKHSDNPDQVRPRHFDVFVLNDQQKTLSARAKVILRWAEEGGVLLIGYELFRLLALKIMTTRKRRGQKSGYAESLGSETHKRLTESVYQALVKPGPDLVICDEGHRIKNSHAGISLALKQIRTRRRVVLTGYPLQNNLLEYWCMVDFVRPNYLGTRTEFCNMFERPIQNGQCIDSTPEDIKLMRYRAHVLHSLLVGFVQRRSHVVLQQTLPQKLEYVILTRMTPFQRQLYDTFMNDVVRKRTVPNPLKAFSVCCKIWNHPDVLYNFLKRYEHDLDIEIEDNEITPDSSSSTTTTTSTTGTATPTPSVVSSVDESQSSSNLSTVNTQDSNLTEDNHNPSKNVEITAVTTKPSYTPRQSLPPTPTNVVNSNGEHTECNGSNNYWLEPNLPYYAPYPPVMPNHDAMQMPATQPDYVGIMVKSTETDNKRTESSEIVDLDTKEIKTVETDIDMERNPLIKAETETTKPTSTDDSPKTEEKSEEDKNKTDAELKPPASVIMERESRWTEGVPYDWAVDLMKKYEADLIENSPKMEVFFCILHESIKLNDRVLLFSQSLLTLNLIERFLQANYVPGTESYWARNVSYFRLDGSTSSQEREKLVNEFNTNVNLKLFLISTRAGSLGINLVGANRVVVFDASWNPCHDTQAVYRIYRYGQRKACFVYRIVMDRCLEKKIYDRQIKKQGMSDRVVDECNPDAHLSLKDVTNLCHDYDNDQFQANDEENFKTPLDSFSDVIVQKVVEQYKSRLSKEPFYHESLLIDRKEKKLSQAEKRQAHRGYEMEKKASIKQTMTCSGNKMQYRIVRNDGVTVTRPVAAIRPLHKNQQNTVRNGGVRSTRWIPAEVWQRQGMTAQEMTLPLDVVIPTNSSDKSNIILKAGQRVMVLKSAKGIYMQLDSGKIIAIRTSSKVTDTTKTETKSNEVIDITAESENANNSQSSTSASNTTNTSRSTSNSSTDNNTNTTNSPNTQLASSDNRKSTTEATKEITTKHDEENHQGDNKIKDRNHHQSQYSIQQQTHLLATTHKKNNNGQKIEINANEKLPTIHGNIRNYQSGNNIYQKTTPIATNIPKKSPLTNINTSTMHQRNNNKLTDEYTNNQLKTKKNQQQQQQQQQQHHINENATNKLIQSQQQHHGNLLQNAQHPTTTTTYNESQITSSSQQQQQQPPPSLPPHHQPLQQHHQSLLDKKPSSLYGDYTHHYGNNNKTTVHQTPTRENERQTKVADINKIESSSFISNHERQQQQSQQQQQQQSTTKQNDVPTNVNQYETQKNNVNSYNATTTTTGQQLPISPKNEKKEQQQLGNECFQNTTTAYHAKTKTESLAVSSGGGGSSVTTSALTQTTNTTTGNSATTNSPYAKLSTDAVQTPYASYNQQQLTAQQQATAAAAAQHQQQSKLRLYMPQYGMPPQHMHPHYNNAVVQQPPAGPPPPTPPSSSSAAAPPPPPPPPSTTTLAAVPPTPTSAHGGYAPKNALFAKAQDVHGYQYYDNMYDCNNMSAMTGCNDYTTAAPPPPPPPPAYTDYTAYAGAHHHSPYHHGNFQANSYGCATLGTPMRAGPYHMHWPPLVASTSLAEHHAVNSIFPTSNYPTDAAAQSNQWHHQ